MALTAIEGGFFDPDTHGYYDEAGKFVPSVTQVLKLTGLSDYSRVDPEVLKAKAELGSNVHGLTEEWDRYGDVDPTWVSERATPYFGAYRLFREQRHFVPDKNWIERPVVATILGMKVGVTPDRFGKLDGQDTVIELKCVESPLLTWGYQTAIQEMAVYKSNFIGRAQRIALQLKKNGKYRTDNHTNHDMDYARAVSALTIVHARLEAGHKVWEEL